MYELKDRTRDGGARVYFLALEADEFILVRAECKSEDEASVALLEDVADVLQTVENQDVRGLLDTGRERGKEL